MPYSQNTFDEDVQRLVREMAPARVLDVGVGAGKYSEIVRAASPSARIIGIEICEDYVERYSLNVKYDELHIVSVVDFCRDNPDFSCDLVIIGDAIEHLSKSAGVDLVHYLIYRCKRCVVIWPSKYVQYSWQGQASEAHRSVWGARDFELFDHTIEARSFMNMAILVGYLDDPAAQLPAPMGYKPI